MRKSTVPGSLLFLAQLFAGCLSIGVFAALVAFGRLS